MPACLDRPLCSTKTDVNGHVTEDCRPRTTNIFVDTAPGAPVDKIDFLFMIDNSTSMSDKQRVLEKAVPDLVDRFVNPVCLGDDGHRENAPGPDALCPAGTHREFQPVKDIHVGIITSSLGAHGAPECLPDPTQSADIQEQLDDHAHLLATRGRALTAIPPGGLAPNALGFLDWNPKRDHTTSDAFKATFEALVPAAGDSGCGFEAQLESVYRFLADPAPPARIDMVPCPSDPNAKCAAPSGVDEDILAERKAFLRPDSIVAVIMLTDENDCSIRDGGQYYLIGDRTWGGTAASSKCATNPNDPCCYSCATGVPEGCAPDPACAAPRPARPDDVNLRCVDQKRRFGFDFLYPVERYMNALTKAQICVTRPDLAADDGQCPAQKNGEPGVVDNPLFANAVAGGLQRPPNQVFFAGIVGVPWQAIQATADENGKPIPDTDLVYKTATTMKSDGTWDLILGEPHPPGGAAPIPPSDPHMVESFAPRPGIQGPSAGFMADPINGHDWTIVRQNDLEYACTFELPEPRDCGVEKAGCDCNQMSFGDNNPLCQAKDGSYGLTQYFAKGYPGSRELEVLRGIGDNAIVASICARNLKDEAPGDFGYRPAVSAIVDRLKVTIGGKCLPRTLRRVDGEYPCSILEATANPAEANCNERPGRTVANPALFGPARDRLRNEKVCDDDPSTPRPDCSAMHFCEIKEAGPTCLKNTEDQPDVGWCYVDPANGQGDRELVQNCAENQQRILRFVDPDRNTPVHDGTVLIACMGADLSQQ